MTAVQEEVRKDQQGLAILKRRRSRPLLLIVDGTLHIAFAEREALTFLQMQFPSHRPRTTLPEALAPLALELIRRCDEICEPSVARMTEGMRFVLRVVPLYGDGADFYTLLIEPEAWREDLTIAAERFALSPREVDVLELILAGMTASEIAAELCIAEVTVFDHFKHISQKTKARNRADMLAKVFNWQPELRCES